MATFSLIFNSIVWFLIVLFTVYVWHGILISKRGKYPPFVPATGEAKKIVLAEVSKILEKSKKPMTVLDPGCGIGSLIIPLAKKFPQHKFVGIEWSYPYYFAKLKSMGLKNVELVHGDMFEQSFGDADIIVCFLVEKLKQPFVEKVVKEVKPETKLFSIYLEMPMLNLEEKFSYKHFGVVDSNVYVYEIENKLRK